MRRARRRGGRFTPTTSCRSYRPTRSFRSRSRSGPPASWSSAASDSSSRSAPRTTRSAPSSTTTRAIGGERARTRFTPVERSTRTCCCRSFRRGSWGRLADSPAGFDQQPCLYGLPGRRASNAPSTRFSRARGELRAETLVLGLEAHRPRQHPPRVVVGAGTATEMNAGTMPRYRLDIPRTPS